MTDPVCLVEGCAYNPFIGRDKSYLAKGYCPNHYYRFKKYGDAATVLTGDKRPAIVVKGIGYALLPLGLNAKGGYAIVDEENAWLDRYKWSDDGHGYAITMRLQQGFYLHHIIMGKPQNGEVVDHVNRNSLDNRMGNLRFVTRQHNNINQGSKKGVSSAHKGVVKIAGVNRWKASIKMDGRTYRMGTFNNERDAALAYDGYARLLFGEFAYINLPNDRLSLGWFTKGRMMRLYGDGFTDDDVARMYQLTEADIQSMTRGVERPERIQ
jgi:hypothetical protein